MSNDKEFFKILEKEISDRFDSEVEILARQTVSILENKTRGIMRQESRIASRKLFNRLKSTVEKSASSYLVNIFSDTAGFIKTGSRIKSDYPSIAKRYENGVIKGFAEKYSGKTRISKAGRLKWGNKGNRVNEMVRKLARKGIHSIKVFEIVLKQAMPAIEKEIINLGIK